MTPPAVGLMYMTSALSSEDVGAFQNLLDPEGNALEVIEQEEKGIYAGLEWLLPTAVIVYVGKAYFDGFLKEMGKDHYALLKEGIKGLRAKLFRPGGPEHMVVGSKGKVQADRPYSLTFSMLAEGQEGLSFKLLFPNAGASAECDLAVSAFLEFLANYHAGRPDAAVIAEMQAIRPVGRTVLLAYEPGLKRLQLVDAMRDTR